MKKIIIFLVFLTMILIIASSCMPVNYCSDYGRNNVSRYQYYHNGKYTPYKNNK